MHRRARVSLFALVAVLVGALLVAGAPGATADPNGRSASDYWTAERMAGAVPRDLVVDHRGLGYLRLPNGELRPHGHSTPAEAPRLRAVQEPNAKPDGAGGGKGGGGGDDGGSKDTAGPVVTDQDPGANATIGESKVFSATVSDPSGVKSVAFVITRPGSSGQSFNASHTGNDVWSVSLQGFTDGSWSWHVVAKDGAKRGGNETTTDPIGFTVETATTGDPDPGVVTNEPWTTGAVTTASGRVYFSMPAFGRFWSDYVCSGTVVDDGTANRSYIITAAHCVYDDANKVFAQNVLFIPDQTGTQANGSNRTCGDDPIGCWAPSHGVVDGNWASRTWPNNIPWDYAFYVVPQNGAHTPGYTDTGTDVLDAAAGTLPVTFDPPTQGAFTHALGYSASEDPNLMYCAEDLGTDSNSYGSLWLGSCGLSGGASGGPWIQPMNTTAGSGPIVGVNSYGYSNSPGMGAAHLSNTGRCVFDTAKLSGANATASCPS